MKNSVSKFIVAVVVLTLACIAIQYIWNSRLPEKMHLQNGLALLAVFPITVTALHFFLLNSTKGAPGNFVRSFMASTVIKFFLYLSVLIGFLMYSTENKQTLIIHFLLYYAVFTVLEVGMLYGELGKKNN